MKAKGRPSWAVSRDDIGTRFGAALSSVGLALMCIGGASHAADLVGWVSEPSTVVSEGVEYAVLDVYAEFDPTNVVVLNVYNAAISNSGGTAFHHSDLNTLSGVAGSWSPGLSGDFAGLDSSIDSFVLVGGVPGGSNTTSLDPNFDPSNAVVPPADAGWFNSNPPNEQGLADPTTGRVWVGRFATIASVAGDTLEFTATTTFAETPGGTAQQVTRSAAFAYPAIECDTLAATAASTSVPASGTSSPVSIAIDVVDAACGWTASSDAAWLTLSATSGSGDASIEFVADANGGAERSGTITIASGTAADVSIVVTQASGETGGELWTPSELSSLAAWFKADVIEGVADGAGVSSWPDASGGPSFGVQANLSKQPRFVANGLNDLPVVRFDGEDDSLLHEQSGNLLRDRSSAVFAIVLRDSEISGGSAWHFPFAHRERVSIPRKLRLQLVTRTAGNGRMTAYSTRTDADTQLASVASGYDGSWHVATVTCDWSNRTMSLHIDGQLLDSDTFATAGNTGDTEIVVDGSSWTHIGSADGNQHFFPGDIAEMLVAATAQSSISANDREQVEGYLAWKWGLEANLPADHPFRNAPPTTGGPVCDTLSADASATTFAAAGTASPESISIDVADPSCNWAVTSDVGWLVPTPSSGTGDASVAFTVAPNTTAMDRSGLVTVVAGTADPVEISISQSGDPCAVDSDGDGVDDCSDGCPQDPLKTSPGACGCGVSDADSDGDGTPDCVDGCPQDPLKTSPGACGCGVSDADSDGDGTPDCLDGCPDDPTKTSPGVCGCGVSDDDLRTWHPDADGDGYGDASSSGTPSCTQPDGFVEDSTDCDDSDPSTYPGAAEVCGDGVDNDCDGAIDEDCGGPVFGGWVAESTIVEFAGIAYSVIDVYASFDAQSVVLNVYNTEISNAGSTAFHHSDINTLSSLAGSWRPELSVSAPSIDPGIDSFVLVGGEPGTGNTTALDPAFDPSDAAVPPANAGWFNSNPPNLQGLSDSTTGRVWVARFATLAGVASETLQFSGSLTYAEHPDGASAQESASAEFAYETIACDQLSATPESLAFDAAGGVADVSIDVGTEGCDWTVTGTTGWLTVSASGGSGDATIVATAIENTSTSSRSAELEISAGTASPVVVVVTQSGADAGCDLAISSENASISFIGSLFGETYGFDVAGDACTWTASSAEEWITIVGGSSGTGSGSVAYEVEVNLYLASRSGSIVVTDASGATSVHQVVQAGPAPECLDPVSFTPVSRIVSGDAAIHTVSVTTNDATSCAWYAESDAPWIVILDGGSFTGAGTITYAVDANEGDPRLGTITIGNGSSLAQHTVEQSGGSCPDSDGDGVDDCSDGCPQDPLKTSPGACGCGVSDADSDGDGTPDCEDGCPEDPLKTEPGACGCGVSDDDLRTWHPDADGDGYGDASSSGTPSCTQPDGFVEDSTDCDDSNPSTYPGAAEVCGDGVDNDCDGAIDEDCGGSGDWTPAQLSTIQTWFRADSITGVGDGEGVSVWSDESGNGRDGTQSNVPRRPAFVSSGLNGLPVVRFDGENDSLLHSGSGDMLRNRASAVFAVALRDVAPTAGEVWHFAFSHRQKATPARKLRIQFVTRTGGTPQFTTYSNREDFEPGLTRVSTGNDGAWRIHLVHCDWVNGVMSHYVDGQLVGADTYPSSGNTSDTSIEVSSTSWTRLGSSDGSQHFFPGEMAELLVATRDAESFEACDLRRVEGYLAHRWGLAENLAEDHPYRSTPPAADGTCGSGLQLPSTVPVIPAAGTVEPVLVPTSGQPATVVIDADADDWLAAELVVNDEQSMVALTASSNQSDRPRSGIVTVTDSFGTSATFSATQWGWCPPSGGDCDGDGLSDACAIAQGAAVDANDNGVPDLCEVGTIAEVPGDFATLGEAVEASTDGWVLRLSPGVHAGPIDLGGRRISIVGFGPPGSVVIDGSSGSVPAIRIGGGEHAEPGSVVLSNIVIRGSGPGAMRGGGVFVTAAEATIEGCVVEGGVAQVGGGVGVFEGGVILVDSIVRTNSAVLGGGMHVESGQALLISSTIGGNAASSEGGGIFVTADGSVCSLLSTSVCGNQPENIAGTVENLDEPAACGCRADLNEDGVVDGADLSLLMAVWGEESGSADLDFNGLVDGADLASLVGMWGTCPE